MADTTPNSSRWHQPLATAYLQLTPDQAQCVRGLLVEQPEAQSVKLAAQLLDLDGFSMENTVKALRFIQNFRDTTDQLTEMQQLFLERLVEKAVEAEYNSVLLLFLKSIDEKGNLANMDLNEPIPADISRTEVAGHLQDLAATDEQKLVAAIPSFPGLAGDLKQYLAREQGDLRGDGRDAVKDEIKKKRSKKLPTLH